MNRNIKTRDRISEQLLINNKILSPQYQNIKFEKTTINQTKKIHQIRPTNFMSSSNIFLKGVSPREKEVEKIILDSKKYQFIIADVCEFYRGLKITLIADENEHKTSQMLLNTHSMQTSKNKVYHTFAMPQISVATKYVKIMVGGFENCCFRIIIQSLKGKIKQKNIIVENNQDIQFNNSLIQINPFHLIEQSQNFRRRKFMNNDKQFTLTTSKSATCFTNILSPVKTQPSEGINLLQNQNISPTQRKSYTNNIRQHVHKISGLKVPQIAQFHKNNNPMKKSILGEKKTINNNVMPNNNNYIKRPQTHYIKNKQEAIYSNNNYLHQPFDQITNTTSRYIRTEIDQQYQRQNNTRLQIKPSNNFSKQQQPTTAAIKKKTLFQSGIQNEISTHKWNIHNR